MQRLPSTLTRILPPLAVWLVLPSQAPAQVVTISDTEFAPTDWSMELVESTGGGSGTASQVASGGNPDAYRSMDISVSSVAHKMFFHAYAGEVFDPADGCGIASVSLFLDAAQFPPFLGEGQGGGMAIRQDGIVYKGAGGFTVPEHSWTTKSFLGYEAEDFTAVGGSAHPDFSATGAPIEVGFTTGNTSIGTAYDTHVGYDNFRFEFTTSPDPASYCTAGTSASGCQALMSSSGTPSASAPSGFFLEAGAVEGQKDGLFFFGTSGRQANPWGNGTSYQCVVPPVKRTPLLVGSGTVGACDGATSYDLNAHWTAKPAHDPGAGSLVQAQLWYRDPLNTSNQPTSFSDALEFLVCQ